MESLLFGFTVVPQTHMMECALLLCPLAPRCQWWDPFLLAPTAATIGTCRKACHRGKPASPFFCFCCAAWYLPDFLTDFIRSLRCLQGNTLAWLPYLEGIPKREFTSGWSKLLSLLVANSCLQITALDPTSLGGERRKCVYCVFHTQIYREKCW